MSKKVICVVGPTACGKTAMGVLLAKAFGGEVISCDSMQIYRGMSIGTAAPTKEEMDGVPHHMVAVADPKESWSAARYEQEVLPVVEDVLGRGKVPVFVGGTGLWMDGVISGHGFAGGQAGGEIRRKLEERRDREGIEGLREELKGIDPAAYERLPAADEKRILRALEVFYETGKTITQHNEESKQIPPRYEASYIGLQFEKREDMWERINLRVDRMVEQGLLEEIDRLMADGLLQTSTALQAIGYKEFTEVWTGTKTREEALEEVKLRSRQYAKRQLTWLRKNPNIHWYVWQEHPNMELAFQDACAYLIKEGFILQNP